MTDGEKKQCPSCGATNPPGAAKCLSCGVRFESDRNVEEDIDKLLSDIFGNEGMDELELDDGAEADDELSLDEGDVAPEDLEIDLERELGLGGEAEVHKELISEPEPEVVDESLLESLLIETVDETEGEVFECPLCGTAVSVDAMSCPGCGAPFAEEEVAAEPDEDMDSLVDELLEIQESGEDVAPGPTVEPESAPAVRPETEVPSAPPEKVPEVTPSAVAVKVEAEVAPPPGAVERKPAPPPSPTKPVSKVEKRAPPRVEREAEMEMTEPRISLMHRFSARIMDVVIAVTIAVMVVTFFVWHLWIWDNWSVGSGVVLFMVALVGFSGAYVMYLVGNSFIVKGDEQYLSGAYREALDFYEKAIRFGTRPSSSAWTNRGNCLRHLGHLEEARQSHEIALRIDERDEVAWANLGAVLLLMNDIPAAIEAYNRSLELKPNYVVAMNNKGVALARMNDVISASRLFRKAIELKPRYKAAWVNLAESLARVGRTEESHRCLEMARRIA